MRSGYRYQKFRTEALKPAPQARAGGAPIRLSIQPTVPGFPYGDMNTSLSLADKLVKEVRKIGD